MHDNKLKHQNKNDKEIYMEDNFCWVNSDNYHLYNFDNQNMFRIKRMVKHIMSRLLS